ncbi:DEAD/DEAH box helicase [Lactococcus nasutitermitis]|uniref:DEAD/DEAH box helicase n=1 Tax=Lactococcus nasutitermitis TaxID=1652957 RepID=A0ABV9JED0_9LACT|nr:DEAD/DEAH box helicase [Lactococcus nasutitermitis]
MENFYGRFLLKKELSTLDDDTDFIKIEGMDNISLTKIKCNRCGTIHEKKQVLLPIHAYYCPTCINLGRVRSDEYLYFLPQQDFPRQQALRWKGTLTTYQEEISEQLVKTIVSPRQILVQAVTGAGKTEMIYQAVAEYLKNGKSIGIASPRIDVCIELYKRFSRDFSCKISLLHGKSEPYSRAPIVICTTHQLLRFREAFDLLIIDEVDAFPFDDNAMLYFAANNARKTDSSLIYLTATSTEKLEKQIKSGDIQKLQLVHRFHGQALVLPEFIWYTKMMKLIIKQRKSKFPLLIFIPEIDFGKQFTQDLQKKLPNENIAFVASSSENRLEAVENFRIGKTTILISTTILERGVTFPKVDVFVIKAEHKNFTKSTLIQIAGRAGRAIERPTGLVYFFHEGKTRAMITTCQEIKAINKAGGFL